MPVARAGAVEEPAGRDRHWILVGEAYVPAGMLKYPVSDWGPAAAALTERGYVVLPGAIAEGGWRTLRAEAERLLGADAFSAARVGRGQGNRQEGATRGGSVCWLDAGMPAGDAFMGWMDGLRLFLNRALFLGLDEFEAHYAHYPVGTSYGTHVDRHRHTEARVVSAVIYLNADWPVDAGGELVIYDDHDAPRLTVAPVGGTLVLFMSDGTPHEARKATRARWSIAGWFSRGGTRTSPHGPPTDFSEVSRASKLALPSLNPLAALALAPWQKAASPCVGG